MPRLNPHHIAHCGGFIAPVSPKKFRAHIRINHVQHRTQFRDLQSAKLWIQGMANEFGSKNKPLTREQLIDATNAQSILPENVSLYEIVKAYVAASRATEKNSAYDSPTSATQHPNSNRHTHLRSMSPKTKHEHIRRSILTPIP